MVVLYKWQHTLPSIGISQKWSAVLFPKGHGWSGALNKLYLASLEEQIVRIADFCYRRMSTPNCWRSIFHDPTKTVMIFLVGQALRHFKWCLCWFDFIFLSLLKLLPAGKFWERSLLLLLNCCSMCRQQGFCHKLHTLGIHICGKQSISHSTFQRKSDINVLHRAIYLFILQL